MTILLATTAISKFTNWPVTTAYVFDVSALGILHFQIFVSTKRL